mmetsp:Transcript_12792/g.26083  ORF Transcript_12792/g.26083 Transcript_12792/m.26083 type:complete len:692 (-) Transcript_12792:163-2238(-)
MLTRSTRRTSLSSTTTLPVTGPGSYTLRKDDRVKPKYTAFGNSEERPEAGVENADGKYGRLAPGPGTYNITTSTPSSSNPGALGFKSTAPRLAPVIPGSSAYMESTSKSNPGPGQYSSTSTSSMISAVQTSVRSSQLSYGAAARANVSRVLDEIPVKFNPPAIPDKMQTFGYESTDEKGFRESIPVPRPSQIHTGVKGDTVGPGSYDLKEWGGGDGGRDGGRESSFILSKTKRQVFVQTQSASNTMPDSSNPGPGNYELKGFDWDKGGSGAAFRSGVKMAHQIEQGKERVEEGRERDILGQDGHVSTGVGKSNFGRNFSRTSSSPQSSYVQSFGTTAYRDTCPRVHSSTVPHPSRANLYAERKIGPGSYNNTSNTIGSNYSGKSGKSLRSEPVGFLGTEERPCLKNDDSRVSLSAPGPGPIYNPEYLTLNFAVQKKSTSSRKIGVFGTTGPRFRARPPSPSHANTPDSSQPFNVGPGGREGDREGNQPQHVMVVKPRYKSAFKMDGVKGGSFGADKPPPGGFVVENSSSYRQSDFNMRDDDTIENYKKKVRPAFGSSAPRTDSSRNIDGNKFRETPGPRYMIKVTDLAPQDKRLVNGGRKREGGICTFGKDIRKFDTGSTSGSAVGPGSYKLPSSISNHSFNITLKSKNKKFVKSSEMHAMKTMARKRMAAAKENQGDDMSLGGGLSLGSF